MKYYVIGIFAIMILIQWFVPGSMIYEQESVLKNGKEFKFKTRPVDPSDPFRGKYIILNFDSEQFPVSDPLNWNRGNEVFVSLDDSAGYAMINAVSQTKPDHPDFIKATVSYVDDNMLYFDYPFDRFYLEERKAPIAEKLYAESQNDTLIEVAAVVGIKNGVAALKDVTIDGKSISEAAANYNQN